jgi:hypothetical protein
LEDRHQLLRAQDLKIEKGKHGGKVGVGGKATDNEICDATVESAIRLRLRDSYLRPKQNRQCGRRELRSLKEFIGEF